MLPDIKAYDGKDAYLFVSYSHEDREKVYPFIATLHKKYNVWFNEEIRYGNEWDMEIAKKLKNCSAFVFMITERSLDSDNCKDELYNARELKKDFINILIDKNTELPDWFKLRYGRYQMCRLFSFSSLEAAMEDLVKKCVFLGPAKRTSSPVSDTSEITKTVMTDNTKQAGIGDIITFGRYVQKVNGSPEPIEWIVLDKKDDEALIISKYALDCQPYNVNPKAVMWATCSLRYWLNGAFLYLAFSPEEQKRIINSTVTDEKKLLYSTLNRFNTKDKVFLLSSSEEWQYREIITSRCLPTEYTTALGVKTYFDRIYGNADCWWWLRSPGCTDDTAKCSGTGTFDGSGYRVESINIGVRPALRINL